MGKKRKRDVAKTPVIEPEVDNRTPKQKRLDRIAKSRETLAENYARFPLLVDQFETKMARINAARKRAQQRVDHLVFDVPRPAPRKVKGRKKGRRRVGQSSRPAELPDGIEQAVALREAWSHKQGTPETHEHFHRTMHHRHALTRMEERGEITSDQKAWGDAIGLIAEEIESDVMARISRYRMPVDQERSGVDAALEALQRVRLHIAYTIWREQLQQPKRLVLDMLVGEQMGYHAAARLHRVGWRRARRLLIEALDRWPDCLAYARRQVGSQDLECAPPANDAAA